MEQESTQEPSSEPGSPDPGQSPPEPAAPRRGGLTSTPMLVGAIAGGIIVVVFAVAILRPGGRTAAPPHRPGPAPGSPTIPAIVRPAIQGAPVPVSPMGTIPHGTITLMWKNPGGLDACEAILFDNLAQPLWRSGRVTSETVTVPRAVLGDMVPGPTYYWRVVGYRPDGTEISANSVPFVLAP